MNDFPNMACPAPGLKALVGSPNPKSNFPAVPPSTTGNSHKLAEIKQGKL
jgi:hypothetical protein